MREVRARPESRGLEAQASIERLVEKVGRIDLHAGEGAGLDALLTRLVRLQRPEAAPERA
jgi:hypothetical protein